MESGDGTEGVDDQDPLKLDESPQKTKKARRKSKQKSERSTEKRSFSGFQARIISQCQSVLRLTMWTGRLLDG